MLEQRNAVEGLPAQYREPGYAVESSHHQSRIKCKEAKEISSPYHKTRANKANKEESFSVCVSERRQTFRGKKCHPSGSNRYMSVPLPCKIFYAEEPNAGTGPYDCNRDGI